MNIFVDFNQVLKSSTGYPGFTRATKIFDSQFSTDSFINIELIDYFKKRPNHVYYIWSASNINILQLFKEKFKPLFKEIISTQNTELYKSEAVNYKKITTKYNLTPQDCLLIDDQLKNAKAAREAEWQAITFSSNESCLRELDKILR